LFLWNDSTRRINFVNDNSIALNAILDKAKLLDNIAQADMNQELEKLTLSIVEKHQKELNEETGIDSSIPETEIKKYVEDAIYFVETERKKKLHSDEK